MILRLVDDDISLIVMLKLDPDIQVERYGCIGFLDPRVYSSLRSGPRMTKKEDSLRLGPRMTTRGDSLTLGFDDDKKRGSLKLKV